MQLGVLLTRPGSAGPAGSTKRMSPGRASARSLNSSGLSSFEPDPGGLSPADGPFRTISSVRAVRASEMTRNAERVPAFREPGGQPHALILDKRAVDQHFAVRASARTRFQASAALTLYDVVGAVSSGAVNAVSFAAVLPAHS